MSIDALQNKIRKLKNPSAVSLILTEDLIPEGMEPGAYLCAMLDALKDLVPAVRIRPAAFFWPGGGGSEAMDAVMRKARELGYYVILDWRYLDTPEEAKAAAARAFQGAWDFDAAIICGYAGSDVIKPWFKAAGKDKDVFVVIKTANKSGSELQDLQTGGRFVFTAAADMISRMGDAAVERCGYSRLAVMAGAYNSSSLKTLREKYPRLFLLVDGVDQPGCNAKNVSYAFDRLGHGALVCGGSSIVGAWKEAEEGTDPIAAAVEAAERMKRNVTRYVTVL